MTEADWIQFLEKVARQYPIKIRNGVTDDDLMDVEQATRALPADLRSFYRVANGLRYEWFDLLPIEVRADIKDTWDGLRRANDPSKTKFFPDNKELLTRFLVFADLGAGHCGCFDKQDGSIWFQDSDGIHQTSFTLNDFIETSLREVAEL